jgi:hypothetical protein
MNDKIVEELEKIRQKNDGYLRPEDVIKEAQNIKNILHSHFEWDNKKAGQEYRLWQARQLISVCVVTIGNKTEPIRAYVSLTTDRHNGNGYRAMTEILTNTKLRSQMLAEALKELQIFKNKYNRLQELAPVFKAIKKIKVS